MAAGCSPAAGTVGLTTALVGTCGFGKTTLARMVANDPGVQAWFTSPGGGGMVWTTIGQQVSGPDLAARVADVIEHLGGRRPATTDPAAAGLELGQLLGDRRVLLVIDDVWERHQFAAIP